MKKPTNKFLSGLFAIFFILSPFLLLAQSSLTEITGIKITTKRDTTIFTPDCNGGECPPAILNRYLFDWDLGDCSKGFGNEVRHVFTEAPTDRITMRAASIYDEDEDPDPIRIGLPGPMVTPLPANTFQMRAQLSRVPVPGDNIEVAVTLDCSYDSLDLVGELSVFESSGLLGRSGLDTSGIVNCGKLRLKEVKYAKNKVSLDSVKNLLEGPTTLLFKYRIPSELEVEKDTVKFTINFKGTGDGVPINTTVFISEAVRGSHDPNELVGEPKEYFLPGEYITYTVHFENIGSEPAKEVVISDFLSPKFLIESVQVLRTEIAGEAVTFEVEIVDRQLIFSYKGAKVQDDTGRVSQKAVLAPSSLDRERSMGLVKFRVKTADTIPCFGDIANAAAIIFDQNPAFVTNCVVHKRFCDCHEYCNYLMEIGFEGLPPQQNNQFGNYPTVPVRKTGSRNGQRIQNPNAPQIETPSESPSADSEALPSWAFALLIVAVAVIILLLILYFLK